MSKQLVPQFILEQFTQGRFYGRFPAATLFLDLSGFTAITNTVMQQGKEGGEVMADVMQAIFDPLVDAVYEQGGFISSFAGDAFTAIFPLPSFSFSVQPHLEAAHQLACQRALAAALAMRKSVSQRPPLAIAGVEFVMSVKIGLGEGSVEWGIVGEPEYEQTAILGEARHAYYFRGTAIDASAMAEQLAGPNEIVLSHGAFVALAGQIETEALSYFRRLTAVIAPLPAPEPYFSSPPEPDLLRIFVPEAVLSHPARGEYRQVLTLMLNLKEVTTREQLLPFSQTVFALQQTYGGYLNTISFDDKGCSLLLFWGMPISQENDLERALNFVLRLREQTAVTFRAGVTYQLMYAGFVGASRSRQEYSCYGKGVNLASRLMMEAPWGQVWVESAVAQQTQRQFHFQPQGNHQFKGFAQPLDVSLFLGLQERSLPQFNGRMVGRQEEMAQLAQWLKPLENGRFIGCLLIRGESGIGKSRLVNELQEKTPTFLPNAHWLHAQTDEILRQSLNPFRHLLYRYFHQANSQSLALNQHRFARQFDALVQSLADVQARQELVRVRSFLAALVNLVSYDSLYEQLTGEARFRNMRQALLAFFQAESRRHPLILHLSDAHWLDEDSWQTLAYLTQITTPLAIILTSRTTPPQFARLNIPVKELELRPLKELALADLALATLGRLPSPDVLQVVANRSDGNPFFAEQILLYLRDQGQPDALNSLMVSPLPLDVRSVLTARLDSLTYEVKRVVEHAAVLGREFDVKLLTHMLRDEPGLLEKIAAAEQAAIWSPLSQLRYLFRHALLRDAAYDIQLRARRRELHILAANALETVFSDDLAPHYEELIYHYCQSQLKDQELHYLRLATDRAQRQYANHDALRFLSRALDLLPPDNLTERYDLLSKREGVYHRLGRRAEQTADLERLQQLADSLDDPCRRIETLCWRARYAMMISDFQTAVSLAESALTQAQSCQNENLLAHACQILGLAVWRQGDYSAAQGHLSRALALWQNRQDETGSANARHYLALLAYEQGDYAASYESYLEVLALRRSLGDREGEASTLNNLGAVANFRGDILLAIQHTEAALHIRRETGHRQGEGGLLLNLAVMWRNLAQFDLAERYLAQAQPISQEVGEPLLEAAIHTNFALLYHQMGHNETAADHGRFALQMLIPLGNPTYLSSAHTWLAHALTALGETAVAAEHYQEAIQLRTAKGQPHLALEPLAGLARLALQTAEQERVAQYGRQLLAGIQATPNLDGLEEPLRVYLTTYECLSAGADPAAPSLLAQAVDQLRRRAANLTDPDLRHAFYHQIPAHRRLLTLDSSAESR